MKRFFCNGRLRSGLLLLTALGLARLSGAAVTARPIFDDNMLLQRNIPIPFFGTGTPGEAVSVSISGPAANASVSGTVDTNGTWLVYLPAQPATAQAHTVTVNGTTYSNVIIGDVWICAGQSNMEGALSSEDGFDNSSIAGKPIRLLKTRVWYDDEKWTTDPKINPTGPDYGPQEERDLFTTWEAVDPADQDTQKFSLAGLVLAREIYDATGVPVGLMQNAMGGTCVEAWTPEDCFDYPLGQAIKDSYYALRAARTGSRDKDGKPQDEPSILYNSLMHHYTKYGVKGFFWWQGEHNCSSWDEPLKKSTNYRFVLPVFIQAMRDRFVHSGPDTLPFMIIQLHSYNANKALGSSEVADVRSAQWAASMSGPEVGLSVSHDIAPQGGTPIHPSNREDYAMRAAAVVLGKWYGIGSSWQFSGPVSHTVSGNSAVIQFTPGLALSTSDGAAPKKFLIRDQNGTLYTATAAITGPTEITVTAPSQANGIRDILYAHEESPSTNLRNSNGLPVSGFDLPEGVSYNLPPTAQIMAPADGTLVALGDAVAVTVSAGDLDGTVDHVELLINGAPYGADDTAAPYEWTLTGLAEGRYTLTAVAEDDDGDRTTSGAVSIDVVNTAVPPVITAQPNSVTQYVGAAASLEVAVWSAVPEEYRWQLDGEDLPGETNALLNIASVQPADAGGYRVIVSNLYGATTGAVAVLTVLDGSIPHITTESLPDAPAGAAYSAALAAEGSDTPMSWSLIGAPEWLSVAASNGTLSGIPADSGVTYFHAIVTDANGDQDLKTFSITVPAGEQILVNGSFDDPFNSNSGTSTQANDPGWYIPNGHVWNLDTVNGWTWADNVGAQALIQVIEDNKTSTGTATFELDVKDTAADGTPNDLQLAVYGTDSAFSISHWNMDIPAGATLLLHETGLAGTSYDWKTLRFPNAINLGESGYTYLIVKLWGEYVDDTAGDFLAIDNCRFMVGSAPDTAYIDWALDRGLSAVKVDDFDGDGFSDFAEYAMNGNPTHAAITPLYLYTVGDTWQQLILARRSDNRLTYTVEAATNLTAGGWTNGGVTTLPGTPLNSDFETVTNRTGSTEAQGYMRLRIAE